MRILSKETFTINDLKTIKRHKTEQETVRWLRDNFESIKSYHACRPVSLKPYYLKGILPLNIGEAEKYMVGIIQSLKYPVEYDFSELKAAHENDSAVLIYLMLDKDDLIKLNPHYLIYGSEFVLSMAQSINQSIKQKLRKVGIPTIIHCHIPLTELPDHELTAFFRRIKGSTDSDETTLKYLFGNFSIIVARHVQPAYIVAHEHVTCALKDVHDYCTYQNTIDKCDMCSE